MKDPHGSAKFMTKRKEELLQGGRRARDTNDWASRDTCDRYTGTEKEGKGWRALGQKGEGLPASRVDSSLSKPCDGWMNG
jgi:hypothetical protein